jgi:hypothetical protein
LVALLRLDQHWVKAILHQLEGFLRLTTGIFKRDGGVFSNGDALGASGLDAPLS